MFNHADSNIHSNLELTDQIRHITKNVAELPTGMNVNEIEEIVCFIETLKRAEFASSAYFRKEETLLARTVEFDQENGSIFIHLKTHQLERIGKGVHKHVTYSVLYDRERPRLVASAIVEANPATCAEVAALQRFRGTPGIIELIGVSKHKKKSGKEVYQIITPLYNGGSLKKYCRENKGKIPIKAKISILRNVLRGAVAINEMGCVMGDNHDGNVFVHEEAGSVRAVLGDLGGYTEDVLSAFNRKPFGPSCRAAPPDLLIAYKEGTLQPSDLLSHHVYTLGRIMYECFYEEAQPWRDSSKDNYPLLRNMYKDKTNSGLDGEIERLRQEILSQIECRRIELQEKETRSLKDELELIVLQMLSFDKETRKTNAYWLERLEALLI